MLMTKKLQGQEPVAGLALEQRWHLSLGQFVRTVTDLHPALPFRSANSGPMMATPARAAAALLARVRSEGYVDNKLSGVLAVHSADVPRDSNVGRNKRFQDRELVVAAERV